MQVLELEIEHMIRFRKDVPPIASYMLTSSRLTLGKLDVSLVLAGATHSVDRVEDDAS